MTPTSDASQYRAAVIGLGYIGAGDPVSAEASGHAPREGNNHAHALANHPAVALAAGSTRDEGRRQRFAQRFGVTNLYQDWREMIERERLDIVGVATHTPSHGEIAIACAEAGVRVIFCEKPLTTSLKEADRVIEACQRHGALLVVSHNRRWDALWRSARDIIQAGEVGEISHVTCQWASGRLGNIGSHMFDTVAMLLARRPVAVSGVLDPVVPPDRRGPGYHDPGGWGVVMFEGGVKVFVDAAHDVRAPFGVRVVGSAAELTIVDGQARLEPREGEDRALSRPPDARNTFAVAVDEIVECLQGNGESSSSGEQGRDALEVIIGLHASHTRRGQWVSLPLEGQDRDIEVNVG